MKYYWEGKPIPEKRTICTEMKLVRMLGRAGHMNISYPSPGILQLTGAPNSALHGFFVTQLPKGSWWYSWVERYKVVYRFITNEKGLKDPKPLKSIFTE